MLKQCSKCKQEKPLDHYYLNRGSRNTGKRAGYSSACIECERARMAKPGAISRKKKYQKKRIKLDYQNKKKYNKNNPQKEKAWQAVRYRLSTGDLIKKSCEVCGCVESHAHHDDYSKPLEVIWLCPTHHKERHRKILD